MLRLRLLAPLLLGATAACTSDTPTAAPDRGPSLHEDHAGPGSSGPDLHTKNVKLLANVARLSGTQTDLAFAGRYAYAGNYGGFRVIDISDPESPVIVSDVACNGPQGDVSVYGNLLFLSADSPQSSSGCNSHTVSGFSPGMFEGIRIFDISNPTSPQFVVAVPTDCGSHTNTLVPDPANGRVLVYVSSYPGNSAGSPACAPPHGYISIINVPLANPVGATVSKYFLDGGTQNFGSRRGCHDITVFLEINRAAAACMSENQMWDITDPLNPVFLWRFDDPIGFFWHSAAFSWDGTVVAFGDEAGGGAASGYCTDPADLQGRLWFVDAETGALRATYKIPRVETGVCTAHNFNFIPQPKGRKVLVSAWYTGGTSVVDVDKLLAGASSDQSEIGFYRPSGGRVWSSYWYNGFIYTNDMNRGVDVMLLSDNARAAARKLDVMNPQTQERLIY